MREHENILISVDHTHALSMLSGLKTAEVRRRQLRVQPGTQLWIYSKLPRGCVELAAKVEEIVAAPPRHLWKNYGYRLAITLSEFENYLSGTETACAILLRDITPLRPTLRLELLRRTTDDFHPPQFSKRLTANCRVLQKLKASYSPA